MCNKCRQIFTVQVEFEQNYKLPAPTACPSADGCNSFKFTEMNGVRRESSKCKDYQELKIQEQVCVQISKNVLRKKIKIMANNSFKCQCPIWST